MAAARRGTPCPLCGQPKTSNGDRPCRKCDHIGSRKPRLCEVCGNGYKPTHSLQRTCGRACGLRIQTRYAAPRVKVRASRLDWHDCDVCGRLISKPGRLRCSDDCRREAARESFRRQFTSQAQVTTRPCEDCGRDHTTKTARNGGVCRRCQVRRRKAVEGTNDRKRARRYGVEYEPVQRIKVYERDRWRCGLCGKPVKPTAKVPHPLAPTLDHVLPLSAGGGHTYANTQCAHFICNSRKGNGGEQQLALVG